MTSGDHKTWYGRAVKEAQETTSISGGMSYGNMAGMDRSKMLADMKSNLTNKVLPQVMSKVKTEMDAACQKIIQQITAAGVDQGAAEQMAMGLIASWAQGGGSSGYDMAGMASQIAEGMIGG